MFDIYIPLNTPGAEHIEGHHHRNDVGQRSGGTWGFCKTGRGDEIDGLHMDVSENSGTPKSSILIGLSIINHPFWGTPIFGNTHIFVACIEW